MARDVAFGKMKRTRDQIMALLREHLPYLSARYGVKRIGLFGSYARGVQSESSDVDLLVEFDRPIGLDFVELADYLERLLGCKVDLLTPSGVQRIRVESVRESIMKELTYV